MISRQFPKATSAETNQLFHYYEASIGPFRNLSALPEEEADQVQRSLRQAPSMFASQRFDDYMVVRRQLEAQARALFLAKGGSPANAYPHYMTLGPCEWIKAWYENAEVLQIPLDEFDPASISFTYGDLFPTMRYQDEKPYRKNVYSITEIFKLIDEYGWPQVWNRDGDHGPERYIEVQVWDDAVIRRFF